MTGKKPSPVNNKKVKTILINDLSVSSNTEHTKRIQTQEQNVAATYLLKANNNTSQPEKLWDYRTKKANPSFIT